MSLPLTRPASAKLRPWLAARARRTPLGAALLPIWPFVAPEWRLLALAGVLALGSITIEVATPLLIGRFLDTVLAQLSPNTTAGGTAGQTLSLLAAAALGRGALLAAQRSAAGRIGERVSARIRVALWGHVQQLPLEYSRRLGPGRIALRFVGDTRAVQRLVTQGLVQLSQELLLGGAVLMAMLLISWRMAAAVLLLVPVYALLFSRWNPELRKASRARRRYRSRMSAYLHERVGGMAVVKALVQQPAEQRSFERLSGQLARRGARFAALDGQLQGVAAALVGLSGAGVLALATAEAANGQITPGSLVAFYTLLGLLMPIFQRVVVANRYIQEAQISAERLAATLALPPETHSAPNQPPLRVERGALAFEQVCFAYRNGPSVMRLVDLQASRGELIALVGANGAGKSTLLQLLLRFYQPTSGRILIDGQDIAGVALESLRASIGLVAQDTPLFSGTIAENVRYGVPANTSDEQIERAARFSGLDKLVAELPDGWDTAVGPLGGALSAGQRQRVALARALAADPPILALDEATSAIDAETEQALAQTIRALAATKTVIVAAHRLPTLLLADWIYVLEQGRVAEAGTHDALLARGGVYTRLFGASPPQP